MGTKTLKVYFGATAISNMVLTQVATAWWSEALVVVTGASAQKASAYLNQISSDPRYSTPAEAISGAITVKTTGQTSNTADEITSQMLIVEIIPA